MWKVIGRVALLITSRSPIQNAVGGKGALPSTSPHLNAKDALPPHSPNLVLFFLFLHPISSFSLFTPFFQPLRSHYTASLFPLLPSFATPALLLPDYIVYFLLPDLLPLSSSISPSCALTSPFARTSKNK